MKKSLMLVGALMISTFIFAQHDAAPQKHRGDRGETMKTVLSLDDTQYSSIKEINRKYEEKSKTLRKDSTMKRDDKFKAYKDMNEQRQSEIGKVLTPEQTTKWTAYKKERVEKRKAEGEKRMKDREESLRKDLSLTDDQANKLKAADKDAQDKHKKVTEDHDKKVKSILSDEQYKKMNDMKSKHRHGLRRGHHKK